VPVGTGADVRPRGGHQRRSLERHHCRQSFVGWTECLTAVLSQLAMSSQGTGGSVPVHRCLGSLVVTGHDQFGVQPTRSGGFDDGPSAPSELVELGGGKDVDDEPADLTDVAWCDLANLPPPCRR